MPSKIEIDSCQLLSGSLATSGEMNTCTTVMHKWNLAYYCVAITKIRGGGRTWNAKRGQSTRSMN